MVGVLRALRGKEKTRNRLRGLKFCWSWRSDLNGQPADYKSAALPIELRQHPTLQILNIAYRWIKHQCRLERTVSAGSAWVSITQVRSLTDSRNRCQIGFSRFSADKIL